MNMQITIWNRKLKAKQKNSSKNDKTVFFYEGITGYPGVSTEDEAFFRFWSWKSSPIMGYLPKKNMVAEFW